MDNRIDFVLPWLDGSDPIWKEERDKYASLSDSFHVDKREIRFRSWDNLQYWFRSIESNAPWVNNVFFITMGQVPEWLNTAHPKLKIIDHNDYIPKKYLPTFNSHTIELNLHRIPDLEEQFVLFNDDIFLLSPVKESDFFYNGLPCDCCVSNIVAPFEGSFSPILLNDLSVINSYFNKRFDMIRHFNKWFNPIYGSLLFRTFLLLPWSYYTGFYNHHLAMPYLKTTYREVWDIIDNQLDITCQNKFRDNNDLNQYIFKYWQFASGRFHPSKPLGKYYNAGERDDEMIECIRGGKDKMICINDSDVIEEFDYIKNRVEDALRNRYPYKSSFEF